MENEAHISPPRAICVIRAILSLFCVLPPILVGVLAVFVALDCEINSKYVEGASMQRLAIASLVAVLFPLICLFLFKGQRDPFRSVASKAISFLPALSALYLAYYSLVVGLEKWDGAIFCLSVATAIFFALKFFDGFETLKLICTFSIFALSTIIFASLYSDFHVELNSIYKLAIQFGAAALIVGTIADARTLLSRIGCGWFIVLKSWAASLSLICSGLIFTAFIREFSVLPHSYSVLSLLYLCYAISALSEIVSLGIGFLKGSLQSTDDHI